MPSSKSRLNLHYGSGGYVFWRISRWPHGGHLGCWNGTNLAVLNLHVSLMPPTKFQFIQTYRSRADVFSRFPSWPPWQPSWILERNQFSNSKSPCHPNASHQVWAQSNLPLVSRHGLKIFKNHGGHLGYQNGKILAILNFYVAPMPPIKFQLNQTYSLGGDVVWRFSIWPMWRPP